MYSLSSNKGCRLRILYIFLYSQKMLPGDESSSYDKSTVSVYMLLVISPRGLVQIHFIALTINSQFLLNTFIRLLSYIYLTIGNAAQDRSA